MRPEVIKIWLQVLWASQLSKYLRFFRWKITCNIPWRPLHRMIAELNDKRYRSGYTGLHLHSGLGSFWWLFWRDELPIHSVTLIVIHRAMVRWPEPAVRLHKTLSLLDQYRIKSWQSCKNYDLVTILPLTTYSQQGLHLLDQYLNCSRRSARCQAAV